MQYQSMNITRHNADTANPPKCNANCTYALLNVLYCMCSTVPFCTVSFCTYVQYCTVLYLCAVLYRSVIMCSTVPLCTYVQYCTVMYCMCSAVPFCTVCAVLYRYVLYVQ